MLTGTNSTIAFARLAFLGLALVLGSSAMAQSPAQRLNDYPTFARADYVFACMAANGQGRDVLQKCACSVDVVASILPYEKYVEAETVLSLRQTGGERMSVFRTTQLAKNLVADLRRAQAEAEIICF